MKFNQSISFGRLVSAIISMMALAGPFCSCARIEENSASGEGYISFSPVTVDYHVEGIMPTKASVPEADLPDADDFTVTISGDALGTPLVFDPGELPSEQIPLPEGTYTVSATYGENTFDQPYFHKADNQVSVTLDRTTNVSLTGITLGNAMLAVMLPSDIGNHMSVSEVRLTDGSNTKVMTASELETPDYVYVPSGRAISVTFVGKVNSTDKEITVSLGTLQPQHAYDVVCNLALPEVSFADQSAGAMSGMLYLTSLATSDAAIAGTDFTYQISSDSGATWTVVTPVSKGSHWLVSGLDKTRTYKIKAVYGGLETAPWTFTPADPANDMTLTISHQTESGLLSGSKAVVTGSDISYPSIVKGLITSHGADLVNDAGTVVRTLTGSETGTMSVSNDFPYLPQGTYTLKPYYVIGSEKAYLPTTVKSVSPAPAFTVTAYAETSYSRYLNYKNGVSGYTLALANTEGSGDKVMDIKGTVSISDAILGDSKYSGLISATLTYDGMSMLTNPAVTASTFVPNTLSSSSSIDGNIGMLDGDDLTNQAWGTHYVKATFTFDGVAAKSSTDPNSTVSTVACHITGLPYSVSFYNITSIPSGWTQGGSVSWSGYGWNKGDGADYLRLRGAGNYSARGKVLSPEYHVPADVNIATVLDCYHYASSGDSRNIYVNANTSACSEFTTNGTSVNDGVNFNNFGSVNDVINNITLSTEKRYISITHDIPNEGLRTEFFGVKSLNVKYR